MIRRIFLQLTVAAVATTVALAADKPTAESLLEKYVEITGGMEAYKAVKTQVSKGTVEFVAQGIKGSVTTYNGGPGKSLTVMDIAGIGKISSGQLDGVVWQNSAIQGARIASGKERAQSLRMMRTDAVVNWRELYSETQLEGAEDVDGKPHWKVRFVPMGGGEAEYSWVDQKTGLMTKSMMTLESPMGKIPVETTIKEYRKEGGVLMPVVSEQKMGPQVIRTTIDKVEVNVAIPAEQFALPPEIKALQEKEKEAAKGAAK